MYKPEFVQENEMDEFIWDFLLQVDQQTQNRKPGLVLISMKENDISWILQF